MTKVANEVKWLDKIANTRNTLNFKKLLTENSFKLMHNTGYDLKQLLRFIHDSISTKKLTIW